MSESNSADQKPDLVIHMHNLPETAAALAKLLAASSNLFQRGNDVVKVSVTDDATIIERLNVPSLVNETHAVCRPVVEKVVKHEIILSPQTLPDRVVRLYLAMSGRRDLRQLHGLCHAPILRDDGSIHASAGYDKLTRYWCTGSELLPLSDRPNHKEAQEALLVLRRAFSTFPFADRGETVEKVDLESAPGLDESSFLAAILTAVCRPSLLLSPAILVRAPLLSGAGTGKGSLVHALARIAYGVTPRAFASGGARTELDKRITSALMEAGPIVFLDNVNSAKLESDQIAQIITESSCMSRKLGESTMVPLTSNALLVVTGNAVHVAEDLARRFLVIDLDAHCESPEQRKFDDEHFIATITAQRGQLLGAALTIWRYGRQNELMRGLPLGSFEQWAAWVRNPLLTLGCCDPVNRVNQVKLDDPRRMQVVGFLAAWYQAHGSSGIVLTNLDANVRSVANLNGHSRQMVAAFVGHLVNTVAGGFRLTRERHGLWGPSTYSVTKVGAKDKHTDGNN